MNGITTKAKGPKLEAAVKFLQFVTSREAMELWLPKVGELPARISVARLDDNRNDLTYGPFICGLAHARATRFVDELGQRKVIIDLFDGINLQKMSPADSVHIAAGREQKLLDAHAGH